MANLSYEQACERKAFIIRCLDIITNTQKDNDVIAQMMRFLSGEYNIADDIVQTELKQQKDRHLTVNSKIMTALLREQGEKLYFQAEKRQKLIERCIDMIIFKEPRKDDISEIRSFLVNEYKKESKIVRANIKYVF